GNADLIVAQRQRGGADVGLGDRRRTGGAIRGEGEGAARPLDAHGRGERGGGGVRVAAARRPPERDLRARRARAGRRGGRRRRNATAPSPAATAGGET